MTHPNFCGGDCQKAYFATAQLHCSSQSIAINEHNAKRLNINWTHVPTRNAFLAPAFLIMLATAIYSFSLAVHSDSAASWLIYLTHWSLLIQVTYLGFACYYTTQHTQTTIPWFAKVTWILFAIALPAAITVTLLYWTLVYDGTPVTLENALVHIINTCIMLADSFIGSQPLILSHLIFFWLFAALYLIWSLIYFALTNRQYIYKPLNWDNTHSTLLLTTIIMFIILPLIYTILWTCIFTRDYYHRTRRTETIKI